MVVVVRSYWPQSLYCQMDKTGDCGRTQILRNMHAFLSKESIAEIGDKCQSGFHTGPSFLPTRNVSGCPVPVT